MEEGMSRVRILGIYWKKTEACVHYKFHEDGVFLFFLQ